ncbi:MAG: DUF2911 domain-containing protein [Vicinamibacterales bacterium]|nr:DUF2911 domain-containing protein [Vicinamibacterales bacterium]
MTTRTWTGLMNVVPMLAIPLMGCGGGASGPAPSTQPIEERAGARDVQASGNDLPIIAPDDVQKSQSAAVFQRVANTDIEVVYDRPVARGRELFGGIVAFDEVWNPGANDATAISFSRDVTVNGEPVAAGRYSLWASPGASDWTVIFSTAADVYHTPYPGEEHDALRLQITPRRGNHVESLAYYFPMVEGKETELRLHWGETIVPMLITVP